MAQKHSVQPHDVDRQAKLCVGGYDAFYPWTLPGLAVVCAGAELS